MLKQPHSSLNHQICFGTALKMKSTWKTSTRVQYLYLPAVLAGGSSPWQRKEKSHWIVGHVGTISNSGSCREVSSQKGQSSPRRLCRLHSWRAPRSDKNLSDLACPCSLSCSKEKIELSDPLRPVTIQIFLIFFPLSSDFQVSLPLTPPQGRNWCYSNYA